LIVVYEKNIAAFEFILGFNSSISKGSAISAWINGDIIYGTPFGINYVPPPYGHFQVSRSLFFGDNAF